MLVRDVELSKIAASIDDPELEEMLSDLIFGGPPGLFPPGIAGEVDDFGAFPDIDPFYPSMPATWSEKKGPARTPPKNPPKQSRRKK